MEVISWLIVQKLMMIFSVISGFWIVTGWRYIWIWRVYLSDPPNFWVSYRWPAGCIKREENVINIAKPYIHKVAGSGIEWNNISNLQLEIPAVYYSWTRAWEIVCTVYHKPSSSNLALLNVNIFLCTQKISRPVHSCMPFSPLHIAFCQLSVLCLHWLICFHFIVLRNWLNKIPENWAILTWNFRCLCHVIFLLHFNSLISI